MFFTVRKVDKPQHSLLETNFVYNIFFRCIAPSSESIAILVKIKDL